MQKKLPLLIGGALVLLLLVGGGIFAYTRRASTASDKSKQDQPKKKKVSEPINVISQSDRPYIQLIPMSSGRNITISMIELKKPATSVEYELEYQAGELLQGAFGSIELGSLPANKDILFGSCSAGGACTYHTDVRGGTLLTKYSGPENYALKQEWKYFENKTK
jgi:hypothetical protein